MDWKYIKTDRARGAQILQQILATIDLPPILRDQTDPTWAIFTRSNIEADTEEFWFTPSAAHSMRVALAAIKATPSGPPKDDASGDETIGRIHLLAGHQGAALKMIQRNERP